MSLITKSILAPIEKEDGYRVSVMSRHTLNDGITPDIRIKENMYDEHLKELAPSAILLGDYYKRNLTWHEFEKRFKQEIIASKLGILEKLCLRALKENVTILCIEQEPYFCHRRLLAEICKKYQPSLEIILK